VAYLADLVEFLFERAVIHQNGAMIEKYFERLDTPVILLAKNWGSSPDTGEG
jgi:hypothetical protein